MAEAAKARGLDGIAITDHDTTMDPNSASSISERTGLIIIPGVEVSTANGHLIVLIPRREYPIKVDFVEAASGAVSDGSVTFIPHPTDPFSHGVGEAVVRRAIPLRLPIESLNASTATRFNNSARELADRLSLPKLAASDAHVSKAVGDAYTLVEVHNRSLQASLEGIRTGRTSPYGSRTSMATTFETVWRRLKRRINRKNP
jgi:hypothetical protein